MIPFRLSFLLGMAETVIYRCMLDQVRERERERERMRGRKIVFMCAFTYVREIYD